MSKIVCDDGKRYCPPNPNEFQSIAESLKEARQEFLRKQCCSVEPQIDRLVFADEQHQKEYDREYRAHWLSLGPQIGYCNVDSIGANGFELVGRGSITNKNCGGFLFLKTCPHPEKHGLTLMGDFSGKTVVHKVFKHCDKPSCPVCYSRGWAFREAESMAHRIKKASEGFTDENGIKFQAQGQPEHGVISVPPSDYSLSYEQLKAKVLKVAYSRGFKGGSMVFHPFRYRKFDIFRGGIRRMRGWYFAPHFHVFGFLLDSYERCRNCPKMKPYTVKTGSGRFVKRVGNEQVCRGCDGFEAMVRKLGFGEIDDVTGKPSGVYVNAKGKKCKADGYIVKIMGKRNTIFGTAWYELNHAGYRIGVKRFRPATWFGTCNSNKLKVTKEYRKHCCPICKSELVKAKYLGQEVFEAFDFYLPSDMVVNLYETDKDGNRFLAWVPDSTPAKSKFG